MVKSLALINFIPYEQILKKLYELSPTPSLSTRNVFVSLPDFENLIVSLFLQTSKAPCQTTT